MPKFHYKAVASDGKVMEGDMEAPSKDTVIVQLQETGFLPISANEVKASITPSSLEYFFNLSRKNIVRSKDITLFTRELATLLRAGLTLEHALKTLEKMSQSVPVKNMVKDIHHRIEGGAQFSDALDTQGGVFNYLYLNMIRAGEAGGRLDNVLERLAEYLERSAEIKANVTSALIYPCLLFFIAGLSLFALLLFVVPQFAVLFEEAGKALPLTTQIVFGIAEFLRQYWWIIIAFIVVTTWMINRQFQDQHQRQRWDAWSLSLPVYGELIAKLEVARFTRTLGTLLMNGVPLLTAVNIVREVLSNSLFINIIDTVTASLEQGNGMARPLAESSHFPELAVQLIQIGETSGQLEEMLLKIADIYDTESQATIKRLLILLEPALILGLGAIIAFIIISIMVAILGLNELII
jgi:general secretion pathway protein F